MTDLEITKACAEAMGWTVGLAEDKRLPDHYRVFAGDRTPIYGIGEEWVISKYDPLHDDAQAMRLLKKFGLYIEWDVNQWLVGKTIRNADLNRAICECVAKMKP